MRIRVITPLITPKFGRFIEREVAEYHIPGVEVDSVICDRGPASIENEYDEAICIPDLLAKICDAEREGVNGVVINCAGDPGLRPARELVDIPVVGCLEAAVHLASMLSHRFSVVTVLPSVIHIFDNVIKLLGVEDKYASTRSVNIPVLELEADHDRLIKALIDESIKCIEIDRAHSIVFGCTGMAGCAEELQTKLAARGYPVPVVDPTLAGVHLAAVLVNMNLKVSRLTYHAPRKKAFAGFEYIKPVKEFAA